jgi:hypothetical protein
LCQAAAKILVLVRRLWDSLAVDELPGGDHRRGLPARLPAAHMARTDARPTAAAGGDRATRATSRPFASGRFSLRAPAPVAPPLPAQYATRRDSWSGSAATRSISTESSNGCWPCSCASRTCGRGRSRADPFRKTNGSGQVHEPGGLLSAMRRGSLTAVTARLPKSADRFPTPLVGYEERLALHRR